LSFLEEILGKERLKGKLNFLVGRGWLIENGGSYKLHQVIKEFLLVNYSPCFDEIEGIFDFFTLLISDEKIRETSYLNNYILYFKALIEISKVFSYNNEKIIFSFIGLGSTYMYLSLYEEALTVYEDVISLSDKLLEKYHPLNGEIYSNLSILYNDIGNYELAFYYARKSLKIHIYVFGLMNIRSVTILNNLAYVYKTKGIYKKALPLYFKALRISKKHNEDISMLHSNIGELYKAIGEYNKALFHAKESVKLREELLGFNHSSTATSYNNQAEIYRELYQYSNAMPLYQKALKINEAIFGVFHIETATNYNNIAMVYEANGEYYKALPLYEKSLEIREKLLGSNHPTTGVAYHNLGVLYMLLSKYEKALEYVKIDIEISEKTLGKYHIDTMASYHSLGNIYYNLGKYQESYKFLKEAIHIGNKILSPHHPKLKITKDSLLNIEEKLKIERVMTKKISQNSPCPCPCNSGKKYKKCCGNNK